MASAYCPSSSIVFFQPRESRRLINAGSSMFISDILLVLLVPCRSNDRRGPLIGAAFGIQPPHEFECIVGQKEFSQFFSVVLP